MVERRPDYYTQFHCLGGACPDTCCRDWSVVLDEDALADYAAAPAPLGERIARNLATDGDGDVCFRLDEAGLCALLTPGGLCAIQKDWGEGHLCAHCAAYPRFTRSYAVNGDALAFSAGGAVLLEAVLLVETYDGWDDPLRRGPGCCHAGGQRARSALLDGGEETSGTGCAHAGGQDLETSFLRGLPAGTIPSTSAIRPFQPRRLAAGTVSEWNPWPDWPNLFEGARPAATPPGPKGIRRPADPIRQANPVERQLTNLACYLVFRTGTRRSTTTRSMAARLRVRRCASYTTLLFQREELWTGSAGGGAQETIWASWIWR